MAVTQVRNVVISSTDGDTLSNFQRLRAIKAVNGASTGSATIKIGSTVVWASGNLAANTATVADEVDIRAIGGDTVTINITAGSPTLYLYLE